MSKPKPKAELIITKAFNECHPQGWLDIRYYSSDARQWIADNAREFTATPLYFDLGISDERSMSLHVDPNYDIDEVKVYLESYLQ